jgi:SAM-dependent methyltransferase
MSEPAKVPTSAAGTDDYYTHVRSEILPLWPGQGLRVLEIGCGAGATLRFLKETGRCSVAKGVEYVPQQAALAREFVDEVVAGDVEQMTLPFAPGSFDVLLCLDVLEHLRDPWSALDRLRALLQPGGCVIASLPNVRFIGVSGALLFAGRWNYTDFGTLDRTHLRFFVRETAVSLFQDRGFDVERVLCTGLEWPGRRALVHVLTLGLMRDLLASQFLIRAVRRD